MLDLILRGGTVIDGTGSAGRVADVGVRDGRIVTIGEVTDDAAEVVDVTGLVVCPGFVDPHTHYDAQLFWDPYATPSSEHGITSVIMGNCGFTLAPIATEADGDYLRKMMVKVEGMPLEALETAVPWNWKTFGEYLGRLDGQVAVNVGALVGHCALRRVVMGDDSVGNEATPEQVAEMVKLLEDSIEAGGIGFSTTQSYTHSDGTGEAVPSRWATRDELLTLCETVSRYDGTTLEWVTDGCMSGFSDDEVDLMAEMSLRGQRPLNWNVLTVDSARPEDYLGQLAAMDTAAERGARVVGLTMPVLVGMNMSFGTYCALNMMPDWKDILGLPIPERMEKLRDPEVRKFMETRAASPEAGVFSRLTGWANYEIGDTYSAANEGLKGKRVGDIARERGVRDFYCLLDIVLEDELRTVLWPGPTDDDPSSWQLRKQAWAHDAIMIGGSDAGAHLDRMAGAMYTTQWIDDCLRGKKLATLEEAIHHLTDKPARLFGLIDRGRLEEGWHADMVVFDPETISAGDVELVPDLPGGHGRLVAEARGIKAVYVNGVATVVDGDTTGDLPGVVFRSGTDTETVSL
ncbi:MAG: amidohydrolase family protein [Acidimicrobiales bacterium]|nr:amidohydrolase family protein [Acidimicrobiales bacterium]